MKSKWISVMFAALVLAGCGSDEAEKGEKKEQVAGQESAAKEKVDNSKANLAKIFAEGSYKADVMAIGLPADLNEKMEKITETMQASLAKNEAWYLETVSGLAEGEILPYDEKLGITENEYKFLLEANEHFQLGKVGESDITITTVDEQTTVQNPTASIVKELTISADGNTLTSDLGDLTYVEEIVASDAQKITGRWNGHFYRMGGENTKQVLQISIGQLEDSKKKVIYTELFEEGQEKKEEILMF
ncbi:hypothetical protein [Lysinibacillus parviboronicapiens]|uniref:hypothetical protein n=1 Tax=Lysinibacillus parviboronicapiens TaxID=436516 RepID=UPI000D3474DA|nr:hypothetical protein [Lysinibacillus parviboronicapiens]